MQASTILAGDVGGTKVNLALCEVREGRLKIFANRRFQSRNYSSLSEVLKEYLKEYLTEKKVSAACFGVPGPVLGGRCRTVNLPWVLEEKELRHELGLESVFLLNDLEAMAQGVQCLSVGKGLAPLRVPKEIASPGNQALIAPGTGLGEAMMIWDGKRHVVSASEGGHVDFGPQNEEQIELLRWLWLKHSHASWEHVASGPGIYRIYRFLKETGREKVSDDLEALLSDPQTDPSPLLAGRALAGTCPVAERVLNLWLFCLGAEAGNLALKSMSLGGLFIGGGVIANIVELFQRPAFFSGFEGKGRISAVLKDVPIYAVTNSYAPLYGAAIAAARRARIGYTFEVCEENP